MATNVTLPALGESVTEGTVTMWLKAVGDTVEVDEPLLEISTDKVDTEIPSPIAGTLLEIKAVEDETVEVGAVLAVIGEAGEAAGESAAPAAEPAAEVAPEPAQAVEEPAAEPAAAAQPEPQAAAEQAPAAPAASGSAAEGTEVTLPALGESVTEGTVTMWLKEVGDTVEVDEPLLEISTDKVDTEIPSPVAGTLLEIRAQVDDTVDVGGVLAIVGSGEAAAAGAPAAPAPEPAAAPAPAPEPAAAPEPEPAPAAPAPAPAPAPATPAASTDSGNADTYVTPIVRKLARQHNVDLATVKGSGVGGRIRKQDILDAAKAAESSTAGAPSAPSAPAGLEPSPLRGKTEKLSRLRKTIASRMLESLQISAQLTTVIEADVTEIVRMRNAHKDAFLSREGTKLTYLPFFAKAAIEALKAYPQVNSLLDMEAGTVTYPEGEHLGIAVDTERGLIVPVIRDAGDLNIAGLARKINDVATRTREGKINPDELSGGTFTLTNTGSRGALFDTPIINQPQVAILGTGAVVKRAAVLTDENGSDSIAVRSMVMLALTYDHRIVDGADAGRFLTAIKDRLEAAEFEGELG